MVLQTQQAECSRTKWFPRKSGSGFRGVGKDGFKGFLEDFWRVLGTRRVLGDVDKDTLGKL